MKSSQTPRRENYTWPSFRECANTACKGAICGALIGGGGIIAYSAFPHSWPVIQEFEKLTTFGFYYGAILAPTVDIGIEAIVGTRRAIDRRLSRGRATASTPGR